MEDILALLFIVISIGSFINKQTKKQAKRKTREPKQEKNPYAEPRPQPDAYKVKQVQPSRARQTTPSQKQRPNQPKSKEQTVKNAANQGSGNTYYEGLEFEERNKIGSMTYVEQDAGTEERHLERDTREQERDLETDGMKAAEEEPQEIGDLLAFSSEDMFRSIVMAEILGTPRAIKRNIR